MRLLSLLFALTLFSGCGWHLRGVMPLPPEYQVLYLQSQASASINQQLKLQLEFNGALLTERAEDAPAILKVDPVSIERRTLSVSSSGQVAEYELNGRLTATLINTGHDREIPLELKAHRILTNDENNVTGTASAEKLQRTEIERELVRKLLRRLQALDNNNEAGQ